MSCDKTEPHFGYSCRLRIDTPELLSQYINGHIGPGYSSVYFFPGAHPNIMSLPKLVASIGNVEYRFEDEHDNVVTLDPYKGVTGIFRKGNSLTLGLPNNHRTYTIFLQKATTLSSDDYTYISQWKSMKTFELIDDASAAYALLQRLNELKSLDLAYIRLKLNLHSYKQLQLKPIYDQWPAIGGVAFYLGMLSREQADEFIQRQEIPQNVTVKMHFPEGLLFFVQKPSIYHA